MEHETGLRVWQSRPEEEDNSVEAGLQRCWERNIVHDQEMLMEAEMRDWSGKSRLHGISCKRTSGREQDRKGDRPGGDVTDWLCEKP